MIAFYGRTLKVVLRFQPLTLLVAVATLALTIFLYIIIPKGFFPTQDTGEIQGVTRELIAYAREKAGDDAVNAIVATVPGLSQFI